jgi:phosphatidylglycerol lysyltransferase
LMRFKPESPNGIMDFLFINLLLYAKENGYKYFNLGMSPLSGLINRESAPLWNKICSLVFGYGERFYNFKGLRNYKSKFNPAWQPKYLAIQGGFILPKILTDITALISARTKVSYQNDEKEVL